MLMGSPAMGLMMALCTVFVFCTDAYLYEVLTVLMSVIDFILREILRVILRLGG